MVFENEERRTKITKLDSYGEKGGGGCCKNSSPVFVVFAKRHMNKMEMHGE